MKPKGTARPIIAADDVRVIEIAKLKSPVPARFQNCYKCKRPAVYIAAGVMTEARYVGIVYPDAESNVFAEAARTLFGTNFEVPVCEEHNQESGGIM
jgi:hypothetical protein